MTTGNAGRAPGTTILRFVGRGRENYLENVGRPRARAPIGVGAREGAGLGESDIGL
jgi:hypothetical protein